MLCDPQSSSPTRAYVNVMEPMGRKYVRNIKTTLYLQIGEMGKEKDENFGRKCEMWCDCNRESNGHELLR